MNEDVLNAIEKIGFKEITKRLYVYTKIKLSKRFWNSGKNSGPSGEEEMDFVGKVIEKSLDQESDWNWNKNRYPNILDFLKSRIDSLISNAINGKENEKNSSKDLMSPSIVTQIKVVNSEAFLNEFEQELDSIIRNKIRNPEDIIFKVYRDIVDGYTNSDLEEIYGLTSNEVTNIKKKIKRALIAYKPKRK